MAIGSRAENAALQRPWVLVLAAALLAGLLVLVLGQAADDETRTRTRATQLQATTYTADVVARTYLDHVALIRTTVASLVLSPRTDNSPLALAVARGDAASLTQVADQVRGQYPRYVIRSFVALRQDPDTVTDATIAASSPTDPSLIGRRLSDLSDPMRTSLDTILPLGRIYLAGMVAPAYVAGPEMAPRLLIAATIPGRGPFPASCGAVCAAIYPRALLIVELDNAKIFVDAASPSLGPDDDAYVLDPQRRLIARVRQPVSVPLLDLSGDPVIGQVGLAEPRIARAGVADPLGQGASLIATAQLQPETGTSRGTTLNLVVARDSSPLDRQLEGTLTQLAVLRFAIVLALVVLAGLAAVAARHLTISAVYQERLSLARDLHDLLGHSLSVLALKTQVAGRRLGSGDRQGAATEMAEIERVARESLQDVRDAVNGYRQPTFGSALAGARTALASAGIDSTLENAAGPLPAAVDATFAWILREAVTNVIRHSRAAHCTVLLARSGDKALLEVVDDGQSSPAPPGNGLRGLHERAAARGGHAKIGPRPEGGFRVQVAIPL